MIGTVSSPILFVAFVAAFPFLFLGWSPHLGPKSKLNASPVLRLVCCGMPLHYSSSQFLATLTLVSTIYSEVRESRSRLNQNTALEKMSTSAGSHKLTAFRGRQSNCNVISTEPICLCLQCLSIHAFIGFGTWLTRSLAWSFKVQWDALAKRLSRTSRATSSFPMARSCQAATGETCCCGTKTSSRSR